MIFKEITRTNNSLSELCNSIVRDFAVIRRQNPDLPEYKICEKLWSFWYMQNRERIWRDGSDFLCERLEELHIERSGPVVEDEIYKVFSEFLLIETGIGIEEYDQYVKAIKLLYSQMRKMQLKTNSSQKEVLDELKFIKKQARNEAKRKY